MIMVPDHDVPPCVEGRIGGFVREGRAIFTSCRAQPRCPVQDTVLGLSTDVFGSRRKEKSTDSNVIASFAERRAAIDTKLAALMEALSIELPQVMLEMQKASVSFRALTEVRNRMVSAYQEIMNMPI